MPKVNFSIYNQLIKIRNKKDIIVPNYKNQQGNPVLFNNSMKKEIMNIKGDVGAKKILELNKTKIDDKIWNKDTIKNIFLYRKLLKL